MIEQLQAINGADGWTKPIVDYLLNTKTEAADFTYQADVYLADFNHNST